MGRFFSNKRTKRSSNRSWIFMWLCKNLFWDFAWDINYTQTHSNKTCSLQEPCLVFCLNLKHKKKQGHDFHSIFNQPRLRFAFDTLFWNHQKVVWAQHFRWPEVLRAATEWPWSKQYNEGRRSCQKKKIMSHVTTWDIIIYISYIIFERQMIFAYNMILYVYICINHMILYVIYIYMYVAI